jgi:hypothetical protein
MLKAGFEPVWLISTPVSPTYWVHQYLKRERDRTSGAGSTESRSAGCAAAAALAQGDTVIVRCHWLSLAVTPQEFTRSSCQPGGPGDWLPADFAARAQTGHHAPALPVTGAPGRGRCCHPGGPSVFCMENHEWLYAINLYNSHHI